MRKNIVFPLLAVLFAATLFSCRKDLNPDVLIPISVKVSFPEYFSVSAAAGTEVSIMNTSTRRTYRGITNEAGEFTWENMVPGNYVVNATRAVSEEEAEQLTPFVQEIFLNGTVRDVLLYENSAPVAIQLTGGQVGGLVFKQIYYTGSRTPLGGSYFSDQFFEIYNNSLDTIYVDSLCIGDTGGAPGNNLNAKPSGFQSDQDNLHLVNVWMIPGNGKSHPIAPGESIIIAQDGINHSSDPLGNPLSIDLGPGVADYETYVERADNRDIDNPDVPNMIPVHLGSVGFDWLVSVFGGSVAIFRHPDPASLEKVKDPNSTAATLYTKIPVEYVIDAVEGLASAAASGFKRLPTSLDAGFQYASGTYVFEAFMRKVRKTVDGVKILQDTNNSTEDFEKITPPLPKSW